MAYDFVSILSNQRDFNITSIPQRCYEISLLDLVESGRNHLINLGLVFRCFATNDHIDNITKRQRLRQGGVC